MYGVSPQGHLYGRTRDNLNTRFSRYRKTDRPVFVQIISCLKGLTEFHHVSHEHEIHMSLEIY